MLRVPRLLHLRPGPIGASTGPLVCLPREKWFTRTVDTTGKIIRWYMLASRRLHLWRRWLKVLGRPEKVEQRL